MTTRDQAYLEILGFGLHRIRDNAALGHLEYCAVESEHLHNTPSLIGETNESRHQYYIQQERDYYLQRVNRSLPGLSFTLADMPNYGQSSNNSEMKTEPNHAMERSRILVTDCAGAHSAPSIRLAHLERSAKISNNHHAH